MVSLDPNITLGAIFVFVPATIGAVASLRNAKHMKTNHGMHIGAHVERIGDQVYDLTRAFERHAADDEERFGQVLEQLVAQRTVADAVKDALNLEP